MISADLGQQLESFVSNLVKAGRYNSKSEVLREGRAADSGAGDALGSAGRIDRAGCCGCGGGAYPPCERCVRGAGGEAYPGRGGGMIVRLAAEAERDLEAIAGRIARENPTRALTFVRELRDACLLLADFPERFALVQRYERHGVRHQVHGNSLIFYQVAEREVIVLHVLHGATVYHGLLFGV